MATPFGARLREVRDALLGISAFTPPEPEVLQQLDLDSPNVERLRAMWGGSLAPPTITKTRWYLQDLENAEHLADMGRLTLVGQLMACARRDGVLAGVLSTRTDGLVRLPRVFRGDPDVVKALEQTHELEATDATVRSVFDEMLPPSELALLAGDGVTCGVGFGELVPVRGRDYPVFVRYEPQFLEYQWNENRWYFRSNSARLPITPGDGKWVLHIPGGRVSPWSTALWRCLGRAYIRKELAALNKDAWENKLAHPARVAESPQGASEPQSQAHWRAVMAWGLNTVFGLKPGYTVKLLESNGRGADSYNKTIADQNNEIVIAIAGQTVTVDGGAGFQNSDIHRTIRSDLIQATADSLAHTINTQVLPQFVAQRYKSVEAVKSRQVAMRWDVTPPKDRNSEASSLVTAAQAIDQLDDALTKYGIALDVAQLCLRFGIPTSKRPDAKSQLGPDGKPVLTLLPGGAADLPGDKAAQDTALNGAQVTSLVQIVIAVASGQLPRDAAAEIVKLAFLVDDERADKALGSAGKGFVPTSTEPAAEPVDAPAPAANPDATEAA